MELHFSEIKAYYDRNFGSGARLYQHFRDQIATDLKACGLDWYVVESKLTWLEGEKTRVNGPAAGLLKGAKTHGVYANYRMVGGIELPMITAASRGQQYGDFVFDGYAELKRLVESERGLVDLTGAQKAKLDELARKAEQRAQQARLKAIAEQENRRKALATDLAAFHKLPELTSETGSGYLDRKQLWGILPHCAGIKRGSNKNGPFIAIPLYAAATRTQQGNGPVYAVQRIYDQPFERTNGERTDKEFSFGMEKMAMAVHAVIGDLATADRIYWCEGWATGASAYLAHLEYLTARYGSAAVVVCLDSGHLPVVMDALLASQPWLLDRSVALLDDDRHKAAEGKGNAGIKAGYQLLARWPGLKAQSPDFSDCHNAATGTDFDDLRQGHPLGLKGVADQLRRKPWQPPKDPFERALAQLPLTHADSLQPAAELAAVAGANSFPAQRSLVQIRAELENVLAAHPWMAPRLDINKVWDRANRQIAYRTKKAHLFRSFSPRITRKTQRPDHIKYKRFDATVVTPEIAAYIAAQGGIVIMRAGMGSGKTQKVSKPSILGSVRAAYFAHRVSLIGAAHGMLTTRAKDGSEDHVPDHVLAEVFHYDERQHFRELNVQKLCSCINSIGKEIFNPILANLDVLVIDEACQTLKAITNGGTMKYPLAVYNRLNQVASRARQVLLLDADANDDLVSWAEELRALRGDDLPIHVVELATDCSHLSVFHADINAVYSDILAQVGNGHRCMIATDSAEEGAKLAHNLRELYPHKTGLFIDANSKAHDADVEKFNNKPSREIYRYDWLIYSPAISSGVSIEPLAGRAPHMTLHYGLFRGVVSPSDAVQMIRRDRSARSFVLGLGQNRYHANTDENAYWRATLRGMIEYDADLEVSPNPETGTVELASGNMPFDRLRIRQICQENVARNDFASVLLLQLMADKYRVQPLHLDNAEAMMAKGKLAKQAAGKVLARLDEERILAAETPSQDRYDHLKRQPRITPDEKAQLDRWAIEHYLQQPVNADSIKWLRNKGLSQAKRFELLQMDEERARRLEAAEVAQQMPDSTRTYHKLTSGLLRAYFTTCGIDLTTGDGAASQEALQAGLALLQGEADFLNAYASWCPPLQKRRSGAPLFKVICDNLNLKATKQRLARKSSAGGTVWTIEPASWEFMLDVQQARAYNGVTSFEEWQVHRPANRPVRLLLGIGQRIVTAHQVPASNAGNLHMLKGDYAGPGRALWRTSQEATPIAPQPPRTISLIEVMGLGYGAETDRGQGGIHDFSNDLIERKKNVDPLPPAAGSVSAGVLELVRGVAERLSCGVRDVLGLLSSTDLTELATGMMNGDELAHYVAGCRAAHGRLFGQGV